MEDTLQAQGSKSIRRERKRTFGSIEQVGAEV